MTTAPFDPRRLAARRERAARSSGDFFLHQRAFEVILEEIEDSGRSCGRTILFDPPVASWAERLGPHAGEIVTLTVDPRSEALPGELADADTIIAIGILGSRNDPPLALHLLRHLLRPSGRLFGADVGGESLSTLRRTLVDAERALGRVSSRFHPLPTGPGIAGALQNAGFASPVVFVDRATVRYRSLARLVSDLRAMGCSNALASPVRPLPRAVLERAERDFAIDDVAEERFDILHFRGIVPHRAS